MANPTLSPGEKRKARARATRERIVEAAFRLMSKRGYGPTTITEIASEAGVAVQTVYFLFHNKAALLRDVFTFAVQGDHESTEPGQRAWFEKMRREPDPRQAIEIAVSATAEIFRRVSPLRAAFQMLADDPETVAFHKHGEQLRHDGYRRIVEVLSSKRKLRRDLGVESATDLVFVLLSPEFYRELTVTRRWPEHRYLRWLTTILEETLFGHSGA